MKDVQLPKENYWSLPTLQTFPFRRLEVLKGEQLSIMFSQCLLSIEKYCLCLGTIDPPYSFGVKKWLAQCKG